MRIAVPKEIKKRETRVSLTPSGAACLVKYGHTVYVEKNAGISAGFSNDEYQNAGAKIKFTAKEMFSDSDIILKVKEPLLSELEFFQPGQIIFTYLHLASNKTLTSALLKKNITSIAYETIQDEKNQLPLLKPMSEIAGRLSVQMASMGLLSPYGGSGMLLSGSTNVKSANVLILGGGTVGKNAAIAAMNMGANVTILDKNKRVLEPLEKQFKGNIHTDLSHDKSIQQNIIRSDVVVGAVLLPGDKAPQLISRDMLKQFKKGSVLVDVAIDQGGCFETSKPTSFDNPFYQIEGVQHCCVANLPAAVAKTATLALTKETLPYLIELLKYGVNSAKNDWLRSGMNTYKGKICNKPLAELFSLPYKAFDV